MHIPSEIAGLIERLNQELNEMEREATDGLALTRTIVDRSPNNFTAIQLLAFWKTTLFFVETSRNRIPSLREDISLSEVTAKQAVKDAAESLATELVRVLETKTEVSGVKNRLEKWQ
ncbi:hypothetical protein [Kamptonema formosum]|uniref:hypothetical protein n=1 Tax=Kamptonema formosum TaxID=331992 RepID=UPI0003495D91|nr:hypothetical protein [Oscillatoria sp. PCC 10802]